MDRDTGIVMIVIGLIMTTLGVIGMLASLEAEHTILLYTDDESITTLSSEFMEYIRKISNEIMQKSTQVNITMDDYLIILKRSDDMLNITIHGNNTPIACVTCRLGTEDQLRCEPKIMDRDRLIAFFNYFNDEESDLSTDHLWRG